MPPECLALEVSEIILCRLKAYKSNLTKSDKHFNIRKQQMEPVWRFMCLSIFDNIYERKKKQTCNLNYAVIFGAGYICWIAASFFFVASIIEKDSTANNFVFFRTSLLREMHFETQPTFFFVCIFRISTTTKSRKLILSTSFFSEMFCVMLCTVIACVGRDNREKKKKTFNRWKCTVAAFLLPARSLSLSPCMHINKVYTLI